MNLTRPLTIQYKGHSLDKEFYTVAVVTLNDVVSAIEDPATLDAVRIDLLEALAIVKNKQEKLWKAKYTQRRIQL